LAAKYPDRVKSLSLHSGWHKSDPYLKTVVNGWQLIAKQMDDMLETVIQGDLSMVLHAELYAQKPDHIQALSDFVRGRPKQPLDSFMLQSNAAVKHDAAAQLGQIRAPTQITFGRHDLVCSTRFADPLKSGIKQSEVHIFEDCSHAALYENVPAFNEKTLAFLRRHAG
jgi:pimeloyl-ACP methyl ester carboxylesterase